MSQSTLTSPKISLPTVANKGEIQLGGVWLRVLQAIWVILVLNDLYTLIVSWAPYYQMLHTVCVGPVADCQSDQLTPQLVSALQRANLSIHDYALYVLSWEILTTCIFLLFGALIMWHKHTTWMGLFMSFFLINIGSLGASFARADAVPNDGPLVLQIFGIVLTLVYYPCLAFFFFTFPDGRLVPRWSWALISLWAVNAFFWLAPRSLNILNWPLLLQSGWLFLVFGGSASTQIYRYRRVASPQQRQQIKWIIPGFGLLLLTTVFSALAFQLFPALSSRDSLLQVAIVPLYRCYYLPAPICVGIALLRYRLWDIDVLINRTLVYGLLTLILAAVYFGLVFGAQALLMGMIGKSDGIAIVVSTLVVAVLFQPLRRGIQNVIDRRFYRQKYDAQRTLQAFSATLHQQTDLAQLSGQIMAVIQETVQPASVSLWLCSPAGRESESASPGQE
ncbi:hypothetical protein KSD_90180 [Ktedonobacter sp. SOSP1-85]|uniref:hypothetical protein n=1 Tax=Ktedonobacter sp. SOSP1-85 TaxID=2778367 RepID=UPI0019167C5B|nr:hypothetical protein [Ktedonobacter sp. SOSP1-85]GHO81247.1 hypothetical protein KSD_90180 [Ktedonobacter sp. SOSP1-85]